MSGIGTTHHVSLNGVKYMLKFDSKNAAVHSYQAPFIDRQSVSTSRSEGDYGQYLVYTQNDWRQGEGQSRMASGGESRYWYSTDADVSGINGALKASKAIEYLAKPGGSAQPNCTGFSKVLLATASFGVMAAWPAEAGASPCAKYFTRYTENGWIQQSDTTYQVVLIGYDAYDILDMVCSGTSTYVSFQGRILKVGASGMMVWNNTTTEAWDYVKLGTDGTSLYGARKIYDAASVSYQTHFYSFPLNGAGNNTATNESATVEGICTALAPHAGTMYALVTIEDAMTTSLYKFDGSNFIMYKNLPDGFVGQSLVTDGSVLYIGGYCHDDDGNLTNNIYYVTGSSSSEVLGLLATMDSVPQGGVGAMTVRGNHLYFPWSDRDGIGRFDRVVGGISCVATDTALSGYFVGGEQLVSMCTYRNKVYASWTDAGGNPGVSVITKFPGSTYSPTATIESSYVDFGLPSTQKLYTSVSVVTPTNLMLGDNLETNPTLALDADSDGVADGFTTVTYGAPALFSIDGGQRIETGVGPGTSLGIQKTYDIVAGEAFSVSVDYKYDGGVNQYTLASAYVTYNGASGTEWLVGAGIPGTGRETIYTTISVSDVVAPAGTTSVVVSLYLDNSSGEGWGEAVWYKNLYVSKTLHNDIGLSYSTNNKTTDWTALGNLWGITPDIDSDTGFYKYTLDLPGGGLKAHSFSPRLDITTTSSINPVVSSLSVNGATLVRAPGKTKPSSTFQFALIVADNLTTVNDDIEEGQSDSKLDNLRTLYQNQSVVELESIVDPGTIYNVIMTGMTEVAASYSPDTQKWEATVNVQLLEI